MTGVQTCALPISAFAELYTLTASQLFGIALRMLRQRDRAEDVLQESFVAIWQRARDYDVSKGTAMTWLITILRHRAIDALRRGARQPERLAEDDARCSRWSPARPTAPIAAANCARCRTVSASSASSHAAPC